VVVPKDPWRSASWPRALVGAVTTKRSLGAHTPVALPLAPNVRFYTQLCSYRTIPGGEASGSRVELRPYPEAKKGRMRRRG
jgi:hypothetical protein